MSRNIMTGADHLALLESDNGLAPAPRDTILTNTDGFKSDSDSPLSGIGGDHGASTDPHMETGGPADAPKTPSVVSMDEPSRKASVGGGKSVGKSKPAPKSTKPKPAGGDDTPWDKKSKKDESDDEMNEGFTFDEAESLDRDCMEHDMAAGEIAVTQDFLVKLLTGVAAANLGEEQFETIAQAISDTAADDRTLDVADIPDVMATLKDMMGASDGGDFDDEPMDDEFDAPEGDDMEAPVDEGSEETRQKGRQKRRNAMADKSRAKQGGGPRPKYRKPKAVPAEDDLTEAWMGTIPHVGNAKQALFTDGMTEDEIEMQEIKRLSGMLDKPRRVF